MRTLLFGYIVEDFGCKNYKVQFENWQSLAVALLIISLQVKKPTLLFFIHVSALSLLHMLHLMLLHRVKIQMKQKRMMNAVILRKRQMMIRLCPQMTRRTGKSLEVFM